MGLLEYRPLVHAVQVLAPGDDPLLVMEPKAQTMQLDTFAGFAAEYSPAAHAVQALAPPEAPAFVLCPASHALQLFFPTWFW